MTKRMRTARERETTKRRARMMRMRRSRRRTLIRIMPRPVMVHSVT